MTKKKIINLLLFVFLIFLSTKCTNKEYNKKSFKGKWEFTRFETEINHLEFTENSVHHIDVSNKNSYEFKYEIKNDSLLLYLNLNGNYELADFYVIMQVEDNKIVLRQFDEIIELKKINNGI